MAIIVHYAWDIGRHSYEKSNDKQYRRINFWNQIATGKTGVSEGQVKSFKSHSFLKSQWNWLSIDANGWVLDNHLSIQILAETYNL